MRREKCERDLMDALAVMVVGVHRIEWLLVIDMPEDMLRRIAAISRVYRVELAEAGLVQCFQRRFFHLEQKAMLRVIVHSEQNAVFGAYRFIVSKSHY